jgi:hypothetical protein
MRGTGRRRIRVWIRKGIRCEVCDSEKYIEIDGFLALLFCFECFFGFFVVFVMFFAI